MKKPRLLPSIYAIYALSTRLHMYINMYVYIVNTMYIWWTAREDETTRVTTIELLPAASVLINLSTITTIPEIESEQLMIIKPL